MAAILLPDAPPEGCGTGPSDAATAAALDALLMG
jgi:hypothetical protein